MFRVLIRKELLESILNFRFLVALLAGLVLIPLSFAVNARDYQARDRNARESLRLYEESRKTLGDMYRDGAILFGPPSPMGLVSGGIEILLPQSVETVGFFTTRGVQTQFNNSRRLDSPFSYLYGRLDLGFIVSVVLAVLALLMTYNSVAGEKERRTLAQILANNVPRTSVILAKAAAQVILLGAVLVFGLVVGVIIILLLGFDVFGLPGFLGSFLAASGLSLLFIFVFTNFGLMISALSRSSTVAVVVSVSCWVVLFMIVPKGGVVLSKILKPVKSQQVIDLEKSQVRRRLEKEEYDAYDRLRTTMPVVQDWSVRDFMDNRRKNDPAALEYVEKQKKIQEEFRSRIDDEIGRIGAFYEGQRDAQAALAKTISRLSPVSCFLHLVTEISRTGFVEFRQWKRNQARFKELLDREICSKIERMSFENFSMGGFPGDRNAPPPRMAFETSSTKSILDDVWPDFVLLLVYGFLFFTGAYVAFLRYDVR
jgi:ABC-type transport system involved in multi-copper enzyme maturation permease subunit